MLDSLHISAFGVQQLSASLNLFGLSVQGGSIAGCCELVLVRRWTDWSLAATHMAQRLSGPWAIPEPSALAKLIAVIIQ